MLRARTQGPLMRKLIPLLAFLALPAAAAPSYDYLDLAAVGFGYDQSGAGTDDDASGGRFRSSIAFDDEWFWTFELAQLSYTAEKGTTWRLGLGYAIPLDDMDLVIKIESGRTDFGTASGGGFGWDVQLRSALWEHFEVNGHLGMADTDPIDSFYRYGVGMVWTPGGSFGLSLEYDLASGEVVDLDGWAVGLRWAF